MNFTEHPVLFGCGVDTLFGILTQPDAPRDTGVLIIVGGPQYRAGSHRQFTLSARMLGAAGLPSLRFDYRGMGDSSGDARTFEDVAPDIAAAIDTLQRQAPTVRRVLLWGLCDAASAALLYLHSTPDPRVQALCLLNPWVRSAASLVRVEVRHYYLDRLRQREFWLKLVRGGVPFAALTQALGKVGSVLRMRAAAVPDAAMPLSYQRRMAAAWRAFPGRILLVLSERDLTAQEFAQHARHDVAWAGLLERPNVTWHEVAGADHTLSDPARRIEVDRLALAWLAAGGHLPVKVADAALAPA